MSTATSPVDPDVISKNSEELVELYKQLAAAVNDKVKSAEIQKKIDDLKKKM